MRMFQILLVLCLTVLSATSADARICFLPASGTCGDYAVVPCDEKNTFKKESDCNAAILSNVQVCKQTVKDGCYKKFCKYENKAACDKEADSLSSSSAHYSCSVDKNSGCYYLESTPCIAQSREYYKACSGYTLNESEKTAKENSGWKCSSCEKSWTDYSCNGKGIVESTEGSETVYSCSKETSESCIGYNTLESKKDAAIANGYNCSPCTKSTTTTDDQGNQTKVDSETVYKCTKTTECGSEYDVSADEVLGKRDEGYTCDPCEVANKDYNNGDEKNISTVKFVYKCERVCEPDQPTKAEDCAEGTFYSPDFSGECGQCFECNDENLATKPSPCGDKGVTCVTSDNSRQGVNPTGCVACNNVKYYEYCITSETCNTGNMKGTCRSIPKSAESTYLSTGWYDTEGRCSTVDKKTELIYVAECASLVEDCMGNYSPAKGKKACDLSDIVAGTSYTPCGGLYYISEEDYNAGKCAKECSYEDKSEDDCTKRGGTVVDSCQTASGETFYDCSVKKDS